MPPQFCDHAFLEDFAAKYKVSVSELIAHFIEQLRKVENYPHHPDIDKFVGIIPANIDVQQVYHDHIEEKHR